MTRMRTLKFDYSPEAYRFSMGDTPDFNLALLASGEGSGADILGLYSGRYPGEGVPIEDVGAHVHVTRGGTVGIWSRRRCRTTMIGDGGTWLGTWANQFVIDPNLNLLGPYTVPAKNVSGVEVLLRELQKLAERHPELGIDLAALEAVQDKEEEYEQQQAMVETSDELGNGGIRGWLDVDRGRGMA